MQHYATLNNTLLENRYCESLFSIIVKAIVEKKNYLKYVDKTSIKFIFKANLTFFMIKTVKQQNFYNIIQECAL